MENTLPDNLIRLNASAVCYIESNPNGRSKNEDSLAVFELTPFPGRPSLLFLAVSDGFDSHDNGDRISRETVRGFARALYTQLTLDPAVNRVQSPPLLTPQAVADGMADAVRQVNTEIVQTIQQNGWDKAGATLTAVAIIGDEAVVVGIGDSPLYHYSAAEGQVRELTQSHNAAAILVRAGLITPEMARHHEGRDHLEFHIGKPELPIKLAAPTVTLRPGDKILLCSDAVSSSISETALAEILNGARLPEMARRLMEEARGEGEADNQTVILWAFDPTSAAEIASRQPAVPAAPVSDAENSNERTAQESDQAELPGRRNPLDLQIKTPPFQEAKRSESVPVSPATWRTDTRVSAGGRNESPLSDAPEITDVPHISSSLPNSAAGDASHGPSRDAGDDFTERADAGELVAVDAPDRHNLREDADPNSAEDKAHASSTGVISLDQYERATVSSEKSVERSSKLSGNPLTRIMQIMGISRPHSDEPVDDEDYRIDEEPKK